MPDTSARRQLKWAERQARDHRLEAQLELQIRGVGLHQGCWQQFQALPERRYRWDFAWPAQRLLVEVQGGTFTQGAHARGAGIRRDCEKLCAATVAGWRVLSIETTMVRDGTGLKFIEAALDSPERAVAASVEEKAAILHQTIPNRS